MLLILVKLRHLANRHRMVVLPVPTQRLVQPQELQVLQVPTLLSRRRMARHRLQLQLLELRGRTPLNSQRMVILRLHKPLVPQELQELQERTLPSSLRMVSRRAQHLDILATHRNSNLDILLSSPNNRATRLNSSHSLDILRSSKPNLVIHPNSLSNLDILLLTNRLMVHQAILPNSQDTLLREHRHIRRLKHMRQLQAILHSSLDTHRSSRDTRHSSQPTEHQPIHLSRAMRSLAILRSSTERLRPTNTLPRVSSTRPRKANIHHRRLNTALHRRPTRLREAISKDVVGLMRDE